MGNKFHNRTFLQNGMSTFGKMFCRKSISGVWSYQTTNQPLIALDILLVGIINWYIPLVLNSPYIGYSIALPILPTVNLSNAAVPLHVQDARVEAALLRARRPAPPGELLSCELYPDEDKVAKAKNGLVLEHRGTTGE